MFFSPGSSLSLSLSLSLSCFMHRSKNARGRGWGEKTRFECDDDDVMLCCVVSRDARAPRRAMKRSKRFCISLSRIFPTRGCVSNSIWWCFFLSCALTVFTAQFLSVCLSVSFDSTSSSSEPAASIRVNNFFQGNP